MKILWNKVTWYSKAIAMGIFIIVPFMGFYLGILYGKTIEFIDQSATDRAVLEQQIPTNNLADYYNNPNAWQVDTDTRGGFTIAYPIDFDAQENNSVAPSTDWRLNANGQPGIAYFKLTVPKAFEPQTNFADATLTIGASENNNAIAQCLAADQSGGPAVATSSIVINNIPLTIFHSTGAGAGNYYETTSYRALHAGRCYAIEYTVHSNQIANYPASYNLHSFDEPKIDALMQNIIGTFNFL